MQFFCDSVALQLHGFADTSDKAYGAGVYVRSIDTYERVYTKPLCAKSRVTHLKVTTIPRLELCAGLVLAKLVENIFQALRLNFERVV